MPQPAYITYRLQGIPKGSSKDDVETFVRKAVHCGNDLNFRVKSLANDLSEPDRMVATLLFRSIPELLSGSSGAEQWHLEVPLDKSGKAEVVLQFDTHFYGCTTLYCPSKEDWKMDEDQVDKVNFGAISGILFFGVPNQGMDIKSLIPMAGDGFNRGFLHTLESQSPVLRTQAQQWSQTDADLNCNIINFYETQASPTARLMTDFSAQAFSPPPSGASNAPLDPASLAASALRETVREILKDTLRAELESMLPVKLREILPETLFQVWPPMLDRLAPEVLDPLVKTNLPGLVEEYMGNDGTVEDYIQSVEVRIQEQADRLNLELQETRDECLKEIGNAERDALERLRKVDWDEWFDEIRGLTPSQESHGGMEARKKVGRNSRLGKGLGTPDGSYSEGELDADGGEVEGWEYHYAQSDGILALSQMGFELYTPTEPNTQSDPDIS
ncbi:hypothetical protein SLS56_007223 [Neofusicoccum ribis]|uniref:Uncharacterized protein n=1 Tax=Neofusicoccum ribis TaxID=45134 RepID=A0ABR3SNN6_9PEZI